MRSYPGAVAPSTNLETFALLGFLFTAYTDRYGTGELRWELSIPERLVLSFATLAEALAFAWAARTGGAA